MINVGHNDSQVARRAGINIRSEYAVVTDEVGRNQVNVDLSAFSPTSHVHSLGDLSDVSLFAESSGEYLRYDGSNWVNTVLAAYTAVSADTGTAQASLVSVELSVVGGDAVSTTAANGTPDTVTIDVNVDDTTIEIAADAIQVKDAGITLAKIQNAALSESILVNQGAAGKAFQEIDDDVAYLPTASAYGATDGLLGWQSGVLSYFTPATVQLVARFTRTSPDLGDEVLATTGGTDLIVSGSGGVVTTGDNTAKSVDIDLDLTSLTAGSPAAADLLIFYDGTMDTRNEKVTFSTFEGLLTHDNLVAGTIASHDTSATGTELDTLTDASNADSLHRHAVLRGTGSGSQEFKVTDNATQDGYLEAVAGAGGGHTLQIATDAVANQNLTIIPGGTGVVIISATSALQVPVGTSAQQPGSPSEGMIRYNTTSNEFEGYQGASPSWSSLGGGGGGAPTDATYIVQTANGTLTNEQALGALATGIVKNTTTTGVLSIAVDGTDYISELSTDPSPQLGANLDSNAFDIVMATADEVQFRVSTQRIYSPSSGVLTIENTTASGTLNIDTAATGTVNIGATSTAIVIGSGTTDVVIGPGSAVATLRGDGAGNLDLGDATNTVQDLYIEGDIAVGTSGLRIGTATTQGIAFYAGTPTTRQASANQAAITLATISGSGDDANINSNFSLIETLLEEIRNVLVTPNFMKGSA